MLMTLYFTGALGYADDVALLAPYDCPAIYTITMCDQFSVEYSIKFQHCNFLLFNATTADVALRLNGELVPNENIRRYI